MMKWDWLINFFKRKKLPEKLRGAAFVAPIVAEVLRWTM